MTIRSDFEVVPAGGGTVDRRFAGVVRSSPGHTAIVESGVEVSYSNLARRVGRVRAGLQRLGIRRADAVGVCLNRGSSLISTLLGVHSTGAAYVPLDARDPVPRLDFQARDARVAAVICERQHERLFDCVSVPVVTYPDLETGPESEALDSTSEPDDLAYIIYTSGSTGQPKGVEVTHRNLICFLDRRNRWTGTTSTRHPAMTDQDPRCRTPPMQHASDGRLLAMAIVGRITADPAIMAGAPAIRGTRITVSAVLGQLAAGSTVEELLAGYPSLIRDNVLAALAFAAETMPQERPFIAA